MTKSATDLMQEIIFSAVLDAIGGLKAASKGLPNTLLRDINAIHANTTFADLPAELQASITASVRTAFQRLLKEGYSVSAGAPAPSRGPRPPRDGERPRREGDRAPPRREGAGPPRREGAGPPRREGERPGPRRSGPRPDGRPGAPRGPGPNRGKPRDR
jgi:hypothetical protein